MARADPLRRGHLNALRSLAKSGGRGAFLNGDHPIFQRTRKSARDVVALLIVLYDQDLIERVPKSDDGWFRITAAGLERIARQRKRAVAKLVSRRGQRSKPCSPVAIGGREKRKTPPKRGQVTA
jgi:hypothetical protein